MQSPFLREIRPKKTQSRNHCMNALVLRRSLSKSLVHVRVLLYKQEPTKVANSRHLFDVLSIGRHIIEFNLPSSRITLSPKTTTSKSPLDCRRVSIFRLALLLAFTSNAQMPIMPMGGGLTAGSQFEALLDSNISLFPASSCLLSYARCCLDWR